MVRDEDAEVIPADRVDTDVKPLIRSTPKKESSVLCSTTHKQREQNEEESIMSTNKKHSEWPKYEGTMRGEEEREGLPFSVSFRGDGNAKERWERNDEENFFVAV